jgi:hypothetical protein
MSGDHGRGPSDEEVQVDVTLEDDLARVEQAVDAYIRNPDDSLRKSLVGTLETLDQQLAWSDDFEGSVISAGALGYGSKGQVIGETNIAPIADDVRGTEFEAQVTLVKAAKDEVRKANAKSLEALRSASAALAANRNSGE